MPMVDGMVAGMADAMAAFLAITHTVGGKREAATTTVEMLAVVSLALDTFALATNMSMSGAPGTMMIVSLRGVV